MGKLARTLAAYGVGIRPTPFASNDIDMVTCEATNALLDLEHTIGMLLDATDTVNDLIALEDAIDTFPDKDLGIIERALYVNAINGAMTKSSPELCLSQELIVAPAVMLFKKSHYSAGIEVKLKQIIDKILHIIKKFKDNIVKWFKKIFSATERLKSKAKRIIKKADALSTGMTKGEDIEISMTLLKDVHVDGQMPDLDQKCQDILKMSDDIYGRRFKLQTDALKGYNDLLKDFDKTHLATIPQTKENDKKYANIKGIEYAYKDIMTYQQYFSDFFIDKRNHYIKGFSNKLISDKRFKDSRTAYIAGPELPGGQGVFLIRAHRLSVKRGSYVKIEVAGKQRTIYAFDDALKQLNKTVMEVNQLDVKVMPISPEKVDIDTDTTMTVLPTHQIAQIAQNIVQILDAMLDGRKQTDNMDKEIAKLEKNIEHLKSKYLYKKSFLPEQRKAVEIMVKASTSIITQLTRLPADFARYNLKTLDAILAICQRHLNVYSTS